MCFKISDGMAHSTKKKPCETLWLENNVIITDGFPTTLGESNVNKCISNSLLLKFNCKKKKNSKNRKYNPEVNGIILIVLKSFLFLFLFVTSFRKLFI